MLAFILLRVALLTEYNFCEMPLFEVRTSGKPYLKNKPEVFFNLSHCKKGVACAVSDCEVGVDIQDYVDYKESTALYFMSREEQLQAKAQNPRAEFTRLWTLKESYGKYTGMGICYNMASHAVTDGAFVGGCISESFLLNGFALSYTSEKRLSSVRIPLSELPANCRKLRKL